MINQKMGGLCYERDETLFQLLNYIGYEVYRIEASLFIDEEEYKKNNS